MSTELTAFPESFPSGTTVKYRKTLSDYPASGGGTLTLHLAGAKNLDATAQADGDDYLVTLTPAATAALPAGLYRWVERWSDGTDVLQVGEGVTTITPDLAASAEGSQQEWLDRVIAALEAHIEGRLPAGIESGQIAGRLISKIPIKEAVQLLSSFRSQLYHVANPQQVTRPVFVRFKQTGFEQ